MGTVSTEIHRKRRLRRHSAPKFPTTPIKGWGNSVGVFGGVKVAQQEAPVYGAVTEEHRGT